MARQSSHQVAPAASQKSKPRDPVAAGTRDAAQNRAAGHNYFLIDRFEAGVALRGTEVKSIREGKANLKDAYGIIKDGEAFLLNAHIGPYSHTGYTTHDALRTRNCCSTRKKFASYKARRSKRDLRSSPHDF